MTKLFGLIFIQIAIATFFVNYPARHQGKDYKGVLGVELAQDSVPDQPADSSPSPAPEPAPEPALSPEPSPPPSEAPTTAPSSDSSSSPTEVTPPPDFAPLPSPNQTDQSNSFADILDSTPLPITPSETTTSKEEATSAGPATMTDSMGTASVLNPTDTINSLEGIKEQAVQEALKEEETIAAATNPIDQTKLSIDYAQDKVRDINDALKTDDFASLNFASQRFNQNLDRAVEKLDLVSPAESGKLKKQLSNFCDQADLVLRYSELAVPEEVEQDLEINRGRCLAVTQ